MSQFDTDEFDETSIGKSSPTANNDGNEAISSPFSYATNAQEHSGYKLATTEGDSPSMSENAVAPFVSRPSESSLSDIQPADSSSSSSAPEQAPIQLNQATTIHSSATDLGLNPSDLHVFVLSDAGKPIYTRFVFVFDNALHGHARLNAFLCQPTLML